ncbi:hypothetical protein ACHAXA_005287 [Cyclostephanos tholiformis]|uniref:Uncharacterized protein n=1 Tax=Cyclostephanos tholiformis TaxID=382380 RepID=A0ABD3RAZ9_9STRA
MRGISDGSRRKHNSSKNHPRAYPYSGENSNIGDGLPRYSLKILGPLAPILLSNDYNDPEELQNRLRLYSVLLLGTSIFFWSWAIYNTLHLRIESGGFDLGVFSFFGSGASSSFLLRSASSGKCCDGNQRFGCCCKKNRSDSGIENEMHSIRLPNRDLDEATIHAPPGIFLLACVVLTQLTVAANYMLGILFSFTAGEKIYVYFATYCSIFSLLWLLVAYSGWVLIIAYRASVARAYGKDSLNGPSSVGLLRGALIALANRSTREVIDNRSYEEEDDIDDELRALYEGRGGYMNS